MLGLKTRKRSHESYRQLAILEDFPWLWAIYHDWSLFSAGKVRVSQNMEDLKIALSRKPEETRFAVWTLTFNNDDARGICFGGEPQPNGKIRVVSTESCSTLVDGVVLETLSHLSISYIALVEKNVSPPEVIIFRHPEKLTLNSVVEETARLCGSNARWGKRWL